MIQMILKSILHSLNFRGLIYFVTILSLTARLLALVGTSRFWWRFHHFGPISGPLAAFLLTVALLVAVEARDVSTRLIWFGILGRSTAISDGVDVLDRVDSTGEIGAGCNEGLDRVL